MALDPTANFAKVEVSTGYDASATSIVLTTGEGAKLPGTQNYNLVWWNATDYPDPADDPNKEIVRVTARTTDTLTVTRNQESSGASTKNTGSKTYNMVLSITKKMIDDIETDIAAGGNTLDFNQFSATGTWSALTGLGSETPASVTLDLTKSGGGRMYVTEDSLVVAWIEKGDLARTAINRPSSSLSVTLEDSVEGIGSFSYTTNSHTISTAPYGIAFKPDGTEMYTIDIGTNNFRQDTLSTAWDITSASVTTSSWPVISGARGIAFKPDGTRCYIPEAVSDTIREYNLSTAWAINTAAAGNNLSVSALTDSPTSIRFRSDGERMFLLDSEGTAGHGRILQYSLSTAWDITTATYDSIEFSLATLDTAPNGICVTDTGKIFVSGQANDLIYQLSMSEPWNLATAKDDEKSLDISAEDANPKDIFCGNDDFSIYMVGDTGNAVYQYDGIASTFSGTAESSILY